jgi:hypothetical protein
MPPLRIRGDPGKVLTMMFPSYLAPPAAAAAAGLPVIFVLNVLVNSSILLMISFSASSSRVRMASTSLTVVLTLNLRVSNLVPTLVALDPAVDISAHADEILLHVAQPL